MEETAYLRQGRRVTLSRKACEALGVKPGDELWLEVSEGKLLIRPRRVVALKALRAVQQGFAEAGITEEELLLGGRQVRAELFREKYGHLLTKEQGK
ncbi:MAG: AbrB/MazE/SpoVT family DNA-binding domain-containing protein [Dehalococcoidia bacterium]